MKLIYKPADGEPREWDFAPDELQDVEAIEIEKRTSLTYTEFGEQFLRGSTLARKALLFVLMKRTNPPLRWESVSFKVGELNVDFDAKEKAGLVEALSKKAIDDPLDKDEQSLLDMLLLEGIEAAAAGPKDSPLASSSESSTSGT